MNRGPRLSMGPKPDAMEISEREKQVLVFMSDGFENKEIGAALGIAEETVKNHVASIMRKLEARSRTHAVAIWVRRSYEVPVLNGPSTSS